MLLKKILILLVFISNLSFAKVATKNDIQMLSKRIDDVLITIKENNKMTLKMMEMNQKATRELIIANQKATDKRFEDMRKYSDKRFEDMRKYSDKRFEDINNRFSDMNKRFDNMITIMLFGFGLIVSIVGFFLVRVVNQEKSVKELTNEIKVVANEVEKSSNKKYFEILVETIKTMAKKDDDFKIILKKYDLVLARN